MLRLLFSFCIFWNLHKVIPQITSDSQNYIGAVVQFYSKIYPDALQMVKENANQYGKIIETAGKVNVDIIVFPEFGLTSFPNFAKEKHFFKALGYEGSSTSEQSENIKNKLLTSKKYKYSSNAIKFRKHFRKIASKIPRPEENVVPCNSNDTYSKSLRMLSCAARNNSIYVVINHYEISDCKWKINCLPEDKLLYNTNVVFDREGRVIARYRKFNLFYEPWADRAQTKLSIFSTDFNVTFVQFTSLDMMNKVAPLVLKQRNVSSAILSTYIFDDLPFFSTVQDHAHWAYEHQINLLSAGFNRDGSSDIYLSTITSITKPMVKPRSNYMLYAKIPRTKYVDPEEKVFYKIVTFDDRETEFNVINLPKSDRFLDRNENLEDYFDTKEWDSELIDEQTYTNKVCIEGKECCYFIVKMEYESSVKQNYTARYSYRAVAFGKEYKLSDGSLLRMEFCGVIACTSNKLSDCGKKFPNDKPVDPSIFHSLVITRYPHENLSASVPFFAPMTSAKGAAMKIGRQFYYEYRITQHSTLLMLHMMMSTENLEIFGINGRILFKDRERKTIKFSHPYVIAVITAGITMAVFAVGWLIVVSIWHCHLKKIIKQEGE